MEVMEATRFSTKWKLHQVRELDLAKKVLKQIASYRASEPFGLERKNKGCYVRRIGKRLKDNSGHIPALLDLSFQPG